MWFGVAFYQSHELIESSRKITLLLVIVIFMLFKVLNYAKFTLPMFDDPRAVGEKCPSSFIFLIVFSNMQFRTKLFMMSQRATMPLTG